MESKKRPSSSGAKSAQKRSKYDPQNIAAAPPKVKVEGKRRSVKAPVLSGSSSASSRNILPSVPSSAGDPGNKTIFTNGSDSDEVFECALEVNATEAVAMAATDKQKRRANNALLKEVS